MNNFWTVGIDADGRKGIFCQQLGKVD